METGKGSVSLNTCCWVIVSHAMFVNQAQYLKARVEHYGFQPVTISDEKPPNLFIEIKFANNGVEIKDGESSSSPEAYSLTVDPKTKSIVITASSISGAFYGVQTILSLALKNLEKGTIPELKVKDEPRFNFRGMHVDVGRNFHSLDSVLSLLEVMAMYKLNKLHLHLTDDEGWRLQIPGLEELTKVGGRRCHDLSETTCVVTQLGSGPFSNTSGSGFYTVDEYSTILGFAAERQIEVIPEIDMPGHGHAAIRSMEARRKRLADQGDFANADTYVLRDPTDTSKYVSTQMFTDNAINPCINSTYNFISYVMGEIKKMHDGINPLRTFHFGGDEVPRGAWINSTACNRLKQFNPGLKEYFTQRVSHAAAERKLNIAAWEDGLMEAGNKPFDRSLLHIPKIYANIWDNVWEWGSGPRAYILANAGYKVIMSHATHLYFDHPYEPDPEERGFYWATRFIDTKKVFGFMPGSLYENIDVKRSGQPITKVDICGAGNEKCPPLENPENIIGMQGQLWSETVRTRDELFYMIFPRLLAVSERAWHKAPWEDMGDAGKREAARADNWEMFANSLGYQELVLLDRLGIPYRIPPPGCRLVNNVLITNSPFPGLSVEASLDEGKTWKVVTRDGLQMENGQRVTLVTKSADNQRRSRSVVMTIEGITAATSSARKSTTSATTCIAVIATLFILSFGKH